MSQLTDYTATGAVELLDFSDDYRAAKAVAQFPLESADVGTIAERAKKLADARHLLLPDVDVLLERCVVALLGGHLVLQGPPGTGKTTLAQVLAEAFNASAHLETATADWSTYDVIGGLHPSTSPSGGETLVPWLGHVPRAAVTCAGVIARQADEDSAESHQAHWLIIDEFSRAEIDKAIGPLYTVLGGSAVDEPLPIWFGATEETQAVYLPQRFRIIGTMNTVDANYVNTFSQGLSRRFQFVYVGVPERNQIPDELTAARHSAADWYASHYGGDAFNAEFLADPRVSRIGAELASFLEAVRYDDAATNRPGWPLGTAQLVDVYRQLALRRPQAAQDPDALLSAFDLALADRIIPQASNLDTAQLDAAEDWLKEHALPRGLAAVQYLRASAATGY